MPGVWRFSGQLCAVHAWRKTWTVTTVVNLNLHAVLSTCSCKIPTKPQAHIRTCSQQALHYTHRNVGPAPAVPRPRDVRPCAFRMLQRAAHQKACRWWPGRSELSRVGGIDGSRSYVYTSYNSTHTHTYIYIYIYTHVYYVSIQA